MTYTRLLVGTDGSDTAALAVRAAARLAKRLSAELAVLMAYDGSREKEEEARARLEAAVAPAIEEGVEPMKLVRDDEPASAVMVTAEEGGIDLIVVGNRGMGKARRFKLGSVPEQIAHSSPTDILIVRTMDQRDPTEARYRTVVIGTDGSPTATEATRRGYEFATSVGADVTLVSAGDPAFAEIVLKDALEKVMGGDEDVRTRAVKADPEDALSKAAAEMDADLVVVGNRGMQGAQRFLAGSVPNKVAHAAPCDVLIVKTVGRSADDLEPGQGGIVLAAGGRVAAYRDEDGTLHAVSPRCTHMGCTVGWNAGAKTWDCPCHGSRYAPDGQVFQGPAERDLRPVELNRP